MRKNWTVLGAVLLVAGISLCAIALASVGFDPRKLGGQTDFEQKRFQVEAGKVAAIEIGDGNNSIELTRSPDGNIAITYYESPKDRYELGVNGDGRLTMRYVDARRWYERVGVRWGHPDTRVTVALPEGFRGDLSLHTVNGSIYAEDQRAGALRAATTNGDILLKGISAAGEASASTVNGKIELSGLTAASVTATSVNGSIQADGVASEGAIELGTTNGSITGSVQGRAEDYTVNAGAVNGACNLANRLGGAKPLSVHTANGSIDVRFLD